MKKVLFCTAVLFLVLAATAFADRAEIEAALEAYEAVVVEAEAMSENPLVDPGDFVTLDEKTAIAEEALAAVAEERWWMIEDAKRAADLRVRFYQSISTIVLNLLKYSTTQLEDAPPAF